MVPGPAKRIQKNESLWLTDQQANPSWGQLSLGSIGLALLSSSALVLCHPPIPVLPPNLPKSPFSHASFPQIKTHYVLFFWKGMCACVSPIFNGTKNTLSLMLCHGATSERHHCHFKEDLHDLLNIFDVSVPALRSHRGCVGTLCYKQLLCLFGSPTFNDNFLLCFETNL